MLNPCGTRLAYEYIYQFFKLRLDNNHNLLVMNLHEYAKSYKKYVIQNSYSNAKNKNK